MDLWSLGCVFGELLNGHVLFPGKSIGKGFEKDQFKLICQYIQQKPIPNTIYHLNVPKEHSLKEKCPEQCLSLLTGLLEFDPILRWSATVIFG